MVDSPELSRTTTRAADIAALAVSDVDATVIAEGAKVDKPKRLADLEPGDRVGRYRIEGKLGAGGMGSVYVAHDPDLDRRVAIKLLHARVDERSGGHQRLLREAQAMARLAHTNVVTVHDVGVVGERLFVAMERLDGSDLKAWLDAGPRPWKEIVAAFVAAGQGLAAAHAAGIIHRDFKPDNVMVASDGRICVGDFGLAAAVRERAQGAEPPSVDGPAPTSVLSTAGSITIPGAIMGTPAYMAPEQMIGGEVTPAADIFSFCVALFEALHGVRPFAGKTVATIFVAIRGGEIVATKTKLPRRLTRALRRGLAAEPEERWPSMDALLAELRSLLAPRGRWLALAGVGLAGALAAALALPEAETIDCSDSGAAVREVWSPARRGAVVDAFKATELIHAEATAERVGAVLDAFAASWEDARKEVCEEGGRGEVSAELNDLRVACLDRQLDELERLLDFLASADREIVNNALAVVRGLPGPERCDPAEVIAAASRRETSPEIEALEARIADAKRLHRAGKYTAAVELLDPVVARLEELGAKEVLAEALTTRSHSAYVDSFADSDARLRRAMAATLAAGDDRRFAMVVADRLGLERGDEAARELWLALGEAAIERYGGSDSTRAKLLNNYGNGLRASGHADRGIAVFEEVVRLHRRGDDPALVADALFNLGTCYVSLDDQERAQALIAEAVEIWQRELGPQHPRMVVALQVLAYSATQLADYDAALASGYEAVALGEAIHRRGHPRMIQIRGLISTVENLRGDFTAALRAADEALVELAESDHPDPPNVSYMQLARGVILFEGGDVDGAVEVLAQAREVLEEPRPENDELAFHLDVNDARVAAARGDVAAAEAAMAAARPIFEVLGKGNKAIAAGYLITRAEVELAAGRIDEGLATVETIRSELRRPLVHPSNVGRLGFIEARLLAAAGREAEAVAAARRSALVLRQLGGDYRRWEAEVEAWLRARERG
ncbi:MAG: serine/threonine-protein kinase [Nannocystaceae bacterium]